IFNCRARSSTAAVSIPAIRISGKLRLSARPSDPPIRPTPKIVTRWGDCSISRVSLLPFEPFDMSALLNDPLKQTLQPRTVERSGVRFFDPLENFLFPFRIIDTQIFGALDLSDFNGAFRTLVQQLNKLPVDLINFPPPIFDGHFPDGSFFHFYYVDTVLSSSMMSGMLCSFF